MSTTLQKVLDGKLQAKDVNHTQENTRNKQSQTSKTNREESTHNKTIGINKHCVLTTHNTRVSIPNKKAECKTRIHPSEAAKKHTSTPRADITSG